MKSFTKNLVTTQEFNQVNDEQLFERIKLVSYMLIFTYPCFFIVDFIFFKNLDRPMFKLVLESVHLTGLVISLIFLMIYRNKKAPKGLIVSGYVSLYLLIGAVSSINSQLFTGNIYAYIIILLGVAVIFPIRPRNLLFQYVTVHILFLIGLYLIESNHYSYLSLLINSTGTAVISFTIALAFYSFRKNDFLNKQKLSRNEESFQRLFNLNPNPLILTKLDSDEIVLMNKQAVEYYPEQVNASFLFSSSNEKQEILNRLLKEKSIKNYVTEQQITANVWKWSLLNFELVDYLEDTCILIDSTDITDMKKKEAELLQHASIDMLTGIRNRRSGIELLRELLKEDTQEFIICYIDINNLKIVNDCYGHSIGDDLIKTCCETISENLNHQDVLFRLGGDEFIVIFFKKKVENVEEVWADIQYAFHEINVSNQKPYEISASHGYYHYKPGTKVTLEEILESADQEMYKKKAIYKALENV
ncbi:GGDEF domain-containing protein [Paenibacillus sp. BSR1-1]|uniref:sensor domain-containing diguanylate cyclase n=1 Tax=Paenibacillus sp. BSR1-1 TaxID=3020845 RepID=UPI0025AF2D54|nr:GGDEF domain-containing protein [Paenibacillus sp. BSR1-1]MDN3017905.1 GGDEF domain-containing protein [Paenibacillus sp. BSR1-1]